MAGVPVPRSYSAIVSDMLDGLLSKLSFPAVRAGSGTLSIIEAAAQSDLRSSQDVFNLLNSGSLDRATGLALDRIGADEDCPRISQSASTGTVTISDTSFTKVSTKIFQGKPAPIIGATTLYVTSGVGFTPTGSIYLGRGTSNYEGPIAYTSAVNNTNYWTLTLATGTTKYHNQGESVVLAQGGNRTIAAGTIVQTTQANAVTAVQFATLYSADLVDGETSLSSVQVVAKTPGLVGNAPAGSVVAFATPPFTGAAVNNPLPYSNGLPTEDDNTYRERIRAVRQSRSRATPLAIKTGLTGIISLAENKRIISCSIVARSNYPTTVYLDDGTGYEESTEGIALETLVDQGLGGEQYFQLVNGRPVSKAYVATTLVAPFGLTSGSRLSCKVGGVLSEHSFSSSEFRSISNASAYEVTASINADSTLSWSARTIGAGTGVALFAKADTQESIEVVAPTSGVDSNAALGFSAGRVDTLRLYKNDVLLTKDGQLASVASNAQGLWQSTSSGETLVIKVDGIDIALSPANTYVISDVDFVNAGTSYRTVSSTNSLVSWATVLNFKVPGITASVVGGTIVITSNRGRTARASVAITGGTLVSKGIFPASSSTGKSFDYTLDRNLGQIRLEDSQVLAAGDRLTAGSYATRAFLQSSSLTTLTIASAGTSFAGEAGAELWFVVDGAAQVVNTRIGTSTPVTFLNTGSWTGGNKVRLYHTPNTLTLFENAQVGDWLIINDPAVTTSNRGAFRITSVVSGGLGVEFERPGTYVGPYESVSLANGLVTVVRTTADLQRVYLPAATNYTAASLATSIASQLRGATAQTYRTKQFRVRTNSFLTEGDIALVNANLEGLKLGLTVGSATSNQTSHLAAVESGNSDIGTPLFEVNTLASSGSTSSTVFDIGSAGILNSSNFIVGLRPLTNATGTRWSNAGHGTTVDSVVGTVFTTRRKAMSTWLAADRIYAASPFAMTPSDELAVVVDGDTTSRRFVMPMYRRVSPGSTTYGITNDLADADLGGISLANAFGLGMDFRDFAVFMPARSKSHAGPDTNKTIMWRYKRLGLEGNRARLQYVYPSTVGQALSVSWSSLTSAYTDIQVTLAAGSTPRAGALISNTTKVGTVAQSIGGGVYQINYLYNLPIGTAQRDVKLNFTGSAGTWVNGNIIVGGTSGATGVITAGATAGAGTLTITTVVGTFVDSEALKVLGTPVATCSGTQYGVVTATLTLPGFASDTGLAAGNVVHVEYNGTGTTAGFSTGNKTILTTPPGQITYVEGTTTIVSTSNVGAVSNDTAAVDISTAGIVVGDIQAVSSSTSLPSSAQQALRVASIASGRLVVQSAVVPSLSTVPVWSLINSTSNITWFPLASNTITSIGAAVNAQTTSPVSAFVAGDGLGDTSGVISVATFEPVGTGGLGSATVDAPWYYFSDGINWVRSHTTPVSTGVNYNFTFKEAITAGLATNSDWANETIRLVPITAENISEYLATSGPGGLFANGEAVVSNRGGRPQITTLTAGSGGSVQVQGGTANSLTATVKGQAAVVASTYSVVTVATSDTIGLSAGHWMRAQNANPMPKARIDLNTDLDSIAADGTVTFANTGTKAWAFAGGASGPLGLLTWQVEKHGDFVAYQYVSGGTPSLAGIAEGDVVHIAATGTVNPRNQGLYRIVRVSDVSKTFWIENSNAVEEVVTLNCAFLAYDSILPGDKLAINTSLWGSSNLGTWTVASIDLTTYDATRGNNQWLFKLDTSTRTPVAVVSPGPAPLGSTNASLVQVIEGSASSLVKRVYSIVPNIADPTLTDIKFDTSAGVTEVSESAGTVLSSLDKLAFSTTTAAGIDGYQHSTGLLEEANKVGYGVDSDPATYPGLIAAGANVNMQGSLIRRISLSLGLRVRTGVTTDDIENAVRSAIATAINNKGVAEQVSISEDIVGPAQSINGVVSVTVLSPTYGVGNDLIAIQPYEKARVLNLDDDIQISFVGE